MALPVMKVMIISACEARETEISIQDREKFPAPKYFHFYVALGFEYKKYEGLYLCVNSHGDWVCSQVVEGSDLGVKFLAKVIEYLKEKGAYIEKN